MLELITDFFTNYILICAFLAWLLAQVAKCLLYIVKYHHFDFLVLVSSGGMPSSHSATVTALVTATAKLCGANSPEFAITFILAFIVMYDACGVRRAAGEQAKVLNRIVSDVQKGDTKYLDKKLKELIGHTPVQVIAGAVLGIILAAFIPVF